MTPDLTRVTFFIDLIPKACGRPRLSKNGVYNPATTTRFKKDFIYLLRDKINNDKTIKKAMVYLYNKPLYLTCDFYFNPPLRLVGKYVSPWKSTYHTTKPDLDNLVKSVKDCMTGIIYRDDSQIVEESIRKRYSPEFGIKVTIREATFLPCYD